MDAANKDGVHYMVKEIAMWDLKQKSLFTFTLDTNACDGTNEQAAEAVDHSMTKLDYDNYRSSLKRITIDAGGCGVYVGLKNELDKVQRNTPDAICHLCSIHALNLIFSNSIIKYLGTGGVGNLNSV